MANVERRKNLTGKHDQTSLRAGKEDKSTSEQTFEAKISSAFTLMQEDLERTARETSTYMDKILGLVGELEEIHLCKQTAFQNIKGHSNTNKDMFDGLFSTYSSLLDEFSPCRMQVIQVGQDATEIQSVRMRKSRKDIMNAAKRHLDEGREKQQLVMDASELMKYYKALIMAV